MFVTWTIHDFFFTVTLLHLLQMIITRVAHLLLHRIKSPENWARYNVHIGEQPTSPHKTHLCTHNWFGNVLVYIYTN